MYYPINDVIRESGLSIDDIRLILMENRPDWEICTEITAAERDIILGASKAKLTGATTITPVNPSEMSLNDQQKMIETASQVLNTKLMLALAEEIAILDAVEVAKNQIILSNRQARQLELAQVINQDWKEAKTKLLDGLKSLSDYVLPQVEVEDSGVNAFDEITRIQAELGKKIVR